MSRFPVAKVNIASGFKPPDRPNHFGLDLAGVAGTPVGAPEDGEFVIVFGVDSDGARADNTNGVDDKRFEGYGPAGVVIKGKSGKFHLLAHLDPQGWAGTIADPLFHNIQIDDPAAVVDRVTIPEVGIVVAEGQQIGRMPTHVGKAGPHVHWEVRLNPVDNPTTRALDTVDPKEWVKNPAVTTTITTVASSKGGIPIWLWVVLGLYLASRRR